MYMQERSYESLRTYFLNKLANIFFGEQNKIIYFFVPFSSSNYMTDNSVMCSGTLFGFAITLNFKELGHAIAEHFSLFRKRTEIIDFPVPFRVLCSIC